MSDPEETFDFEPFLTPDEEEAEENAVSDRQETSLIQEAL